MSASRSPSAYKGPPARRNDELSDLSCLWCGRPLLRYDPERGHRGHYIIKCSRHVCGAKIELYDGTLRVYSRGKCMKENHEHRSDHT